MMVSTELKRKLKKVAARSDRPVFCIEWGSRSCRRREALLLVDQNLLTVGVLFC